MLGSGPESSFRQSDCDLFFVVSCTVIHRDSACCSLFIRDDIAVNDRDVEKRVRSFLACITPQGAGKIQVQVHSGMVVLSGYVNSFREWQLAINAWHRVAGVCNIVDEITVNLGTP